jgi:nucleotide-binding universal stress UspA family protein
MTEQTTMERPAPVAAKQSLLRSILLYVQDDASLDQRTEVALSLARSAGAHLSCLHVTPIQAYVAFDSFGGVFVMNDVIEALEEQESQLRTRLQKKLGAEDVSWDYEQITGDVVSQIVSRAALCDLVVFGREPHRQDFAGPATGLMGELLHRCRTPLFVPGDVHAQVDPAAHALVAWDGSYEAANAVRSSLGLLKLAKTVSVIQVAEDKEQAFPGTGLLQYLSRHDIHADLVVQDPPGSARDPEIVAATLVAHAVGTGAAYIVMGGYSRNRVREFVFGGVTRSLLKECPVPLVLAH